MDKAALIADWEFAVSSGEFPGSMTKAMRYVAAINPQATRRQFVDTLVGVGLDRSTLTKQFGLSRKFDVDAYGVTLDADGREMEPKELAICHRLKFTRSFSVLLTEWPANPC